MAHVHKRNILLRVMLRTYDELRMLFYVLQNSLLFNLIGRLRKNKASLRQSYLSWHLTNCPIKNMQDLMNILSRKEVSIVEGGNTIYIPPQPNLEEIFGELVSFYPPDSGFKILRHFEPPEKVSYVGYCGYSGRGDCYIRRSLTGSICDQIDAANLLHLLKIGPALYDVAEIKTDETSMTCFVVQHIDGDSPTEAEHSTFMEKLQMLIGNGTVALVPHEGLDYIDFKPPDCNRNLIKSSKTGQLMYVDFQQFIVRDKDKLLKNLLEDAKNDLHFGDLRLLRFKKYLYQSIPGTSYIGKRYSSKRWSLLKTLLFNSGIDIAGKIVLDIGCNAGMMVNSALSEGALWGLGWDFPNVAEKATQLNYQLGNTRFTFFPAKLSEKYQLSKDIPNRFNAYLKDSIVFYLAVVNHIGLLCDLGNMPWKALVFEGHDGDTFETLKDILKRIELDWKCKIAATSEIRDGDCGTRCVVIFLRQNNT